MQLRYQLTAVMQSLPAVQQWEMPEEADADAPALLEEREAGEHAAALQQEVAQLRLQLAVRRSASRSDQLHVQVKRSCLWCIRQKHGRSSSRVTSFCQGLRPCSHGC